MVGRLRGSCVRVRATPRCGPSPIALAPRDPSRSCTDLQSIEPTSVAARLASRLHLRPLKNGPWRIPDAGRPDRVIDRVGSSHGLAPSLRDRHPASARSPSGRRGPDCSRTSSHEVHCPFSAPIPESSLPGTRSAVRACGRMCHRPAACRPEATHLRPDTSSVHVPVHCPTADESVAVMDGSCGSGGDHSRANGRRVAVRRTTCGRSPERRAVADRPSIRFQTGTEAPNLPRSRTLPAPLPKEWSRRGYRKHRI
jgi:hypothetical protein